MSKRLYRSKDRMFAGVLSGLAEYMDADPTVIRLLYVFLTLFTGGFPGLIAYVIAVMIVPVKP
ncbi:MAG: PspC domain-containing protein [Bacteroidales bacterium]